jgi:hypothetical protein
VNGYSGGAPPDYEILTESLKDAATRPGRAADARSPASARTTFSNSVNPASPAPRASSQASFLMHRPARAGWMRKVRNNFTIRRKLDGTFV